MPDAHTGPLVNGPGEAFERTCAAPEEVTELPLGSEALDPWLFAQHQQVRSVGPCAEARAAAAAPVDLDALLERLVRRAAWGGDRRRGTARIELGSGELAGAVLTVTAAEGEVAVELELPPGVATDVWERRISERLAERGLYARVDAR